MAPACRSKADDDESLLMFVDGLIAMRTGLVVVAFDGGRVVADTGSRMSKMIADGLTRSQRSPRIVREWSPPRFVSSPVIQPVRSAFSWEGISAS